MGKKATLCAVAMMAAASAQGRPLFDGMFGPGDEPPRGDPRDASEGEAGRGPQRARVPSTAAPMISAAASAMPGVSARPVASISSVVDATGVM